MVIDKNIFTFIHCAAMWKTSLNRLLSSKTGDIANVSSKFVRCCTSVEFNEEPSQTREVVAKRTSITSPKVHGRQHIGLWYTVEDSLANKLFGRRSIPKAYTDLCDIFQETCLMVRQPSLDVISYIKQVNFSLPPAKFLFYGANGVGKSMSIAHVLHYLHEEDYLLIHVPWATRWRKIKSRDAVPSITIVDNLDEPDEGVHWLKNFKIQNEERLAKLNMKTSKFYQWTLREKTNEGDPLIDMINLAIERPVVSCNCIKELILELKLNANEKNCKIAVIMDGINTFYYNHTHYKMKGTPNYADSSRLTLFQAFKPLIEPDWSNAVLVGSVDTLAMDMGRHNQECHYPRTVLGIEGWTALDPFVPVEVLPYNNLEIKSAIDYYLNKKWIQHPSVNTEAGRMELSMVTGNNPRELMKYVAPL